MGRSRVRLSNPWLCGALLGSALFFWVIDRTYEAGAATDPGRTGAACDRSLSAAQKVQVQETYGRLPLHFIANHGQKDSEVRYYAQGGGGRALFFAREGVTFFWRENGKPEPQGIMRKNRGRPEAPKPQREGPSRSIRLLPLGMSPEVEIVTAEPMEAKVNYFRGNDPAKWHSNIPTCGAVVYREAYPGIDLKFYGNGREVEYDVIVRPGADPRKVKFECRGARRLKVKPNGDLAIKLPGGGELVQKKPLIYQEIDGKRVTREGRFELAQGRGVPSYGFAVASYAKEHPLVIDPVLVYSTYLGGNYEDWSYSIAVDSIGCAYVTGTTGSSDFPTKNPLQSWSSGHIGDAYVAKFAPEGNSLAYATYLGGVEIDQDNLGYAIAVDQAGCAYITGMTSANDFPLKNPLQPHLKGFYDAFVTKLNAAGDALVYSTYLGGKISYDENETPWSCGKSIAVDTVGCAYITGYTQSDEFPTKNPLQPQLKGPIDAFVTKLAAGGDALIYSTYLGGSNGYIWSESGNGIAVDQTGCAYVTGDTSSNDFPTKNPLQAQLKGGSDAFVTKINAAGNELVYSTYLGGKDSPWAEGGWEYGSALTVDRNGCVYVTGGTGSINFPTKNPLQPKLKGDDDAFVAKLTVRGDALIYSTYLGGTNGEGGWAIAVDLEGCAYITGLTSSNDFPTKDALQIRKKGPTDAFVAKLNPGGDALVYSTYLGGSSHDSGLGIALDSAGCAYVVGNTSSDDFPTKNQLSNFNLYAEGFVTKIGAAPLPQTGNYLSPIRSLLLD